MTTAFFVLPDAEAGDTRDELLISVDGIIRTLTAEQAAGLAPVYDPAEMAALRWRNHAAWIARLAALTPAQLARQAAAHIAYAQQFGASVISQEQLLRSWRGQIARAQGGDDDVCVVLFELATTDPQALIAFLRVHSAAQRTRLAWTYTSWLARTHGVVREPDFIAKNWAKLAGPAAG